jgi:hypothetical protein
MLGLMQDLPLTTNWILDRAAQYYPTQTVVTRTARRQDLASKDHNVD